MPSLESRYAGKAAAAVPAEVPLYPAAQGPSVPVPYEFQGSAVVTLFRRLHDFDRLAGHLLCHVPGPGDNVLHGGDVPAEAGALLERAAAPHPQSIDDHVVPQERGGA